jgi:hypothetical protein
MEDRDHVEGRDVQAEGPGDMVVPARVRKTLNNAKSGWSLARSISVASGY